MESFKKHDILMVMEAKNQMGNATGLAILVGILALVIGVIAGYAILPVQVVKVEVPIPSAPVITEKVVGNITDLTAKVDALTVEVNEEDNFKELVLNLATDEWTAKKYKDIFDILPNIDEREDITSVKVTDDNVRRINVEDGNARVFQELTVRYEDSDGDHAKVKLEVTTVIEDLEVDTQDIVVL